MYETVWFHFHAITDALLSSLNSSIFLNLRTERAAFAGQLYKFQKMCLEADASLVSKLSDQTWFQQVSVATPETAMECIADIHHLSVLLKDGIQESANYEVTRSVAARIEKKARVLELNTFFVREGDLFKKSRTGRLVAYKFFLFSDHLIYSHQSIMGIGEEERKSLPTETSVQHIHHTHTHTHNQTDCLYHLIVGTEFKVHEQLALAPMTISDIDDPTGCSFFIAHPTKSFVIVAESREVKSLWLRDTFQTIVSCRKREALKNTGQRKMSIIDRIEGQQKSGLPRAPSERSTPFTKRTNPLTVPTLDSPGPSTIGAFSPAASAIQDPQKGHRAVFPVSLPSNCATETSVSSTFSHVTSTPQRKPLENLEVEGPRDGVFSSIMQVATLHMDEIELLTGEGGMSPEGSSGINTPDRASKVSTVTDLKDLSAALEGALDREDRPKGPASSGSGSSDASRRLSETELKAEAEVRNAAKREAVLVFDKRVADLPEKSLRGLFCAVRTSIPFSYCRVHHSLR